METVQQNGRFTLFSNKFLSIYSILYGRNPVDSSRNTVGWSRNPVGWSRDPIGTGVGIL